MKFQIEKKTLDSGKELLFVDNPYFIEYEFPVNEELPEDNIRVYAPVDISHESVIYRLYNIIGFYKEANEENETSFKVDVDSLLDQLSVYDEYWLEHEEKKNRKHSNHGTQLAKEFINVLENIPDGCAECFPFETIDQLKKEYDF